MGSVEKLITENLDIWTSAIQAKSSAGRGNGKKQELYGIKKLRELILELAVRGLLVPQDPNDEPASVLIEKISKEKARLVKEGKIKKSKVISSAGDEEKQFMLPKGWCWSRLGEIGIVASSSRVQKKEWQDKGVPFYRAREIVKLSQNGHVDNELYITEELFEKHSKNGLVPEKGDLMITGVGTIGVPYVVPDNTQFYFKDASVLIFKNLFELYPKFLFYLMKSPLWNNEIHEASMGTTVHTLTIGRANSAMIPIAPIAEQRRIATKTYELMAMCDQLEQHQKTSIAAHQTLVLTLLEALTTASEREGFEAAWKRIAEHFDTLFTTEWSIDQLKQCILQLAVMGKLVPQDPNDEPANELLEITMDVKKQLIKDGVIRNTKKPAPPNDPPSYKLPDTWVWTNLHEIGEIGPRNENEDDSEASFVPMQLISEYYGVPIEHEVKQWGEIRSGFTHFKEGDVVLAKITPCFQNGKSAVMKDLTNGFGAGTTELHVYRSINSCTVPEYVLIYLKSPRFICEGIPKMTGTAGQKRITRDYFAGNHFPLPPVSEQNQIVAKVDELMAICDNLKENLLNAKQKEILFAEVVVHQAVA
ncbi:MAG: restriction endonuclease [Gammaproteobacteria bacterium]|nr:restriction endonuclease [Gammaproteobacteria bacterium]